MSLPLSKFLDTVGDGTGTKNARGDYSSESTEFKIIPPAGVVYKVARLHILIIDTLINADKYGNINNGLTNGVKVCLRDFNDHCIVDFTDGLPVKTNYHWDRLAGIDAEPKKYGNGNEALAVRVTFRRFFGDLTLTSNKFYLSVIVNDDLAGLIEHYFVAQGTQI